MRDFGTAWLPAGVTPEWMMGEGPGTHVVSAEFKQVVDIGEFDK